MLVRTWRAASIGGIEIRIDASLAFVFFLVAYIVGARVLPYQSPGYTAFVYLLVGLSAAVIFIASIVWHELAHALVALHFRIPVMRIVLHLFGGVAHISRDPERPAQEFLVAVAGPASSLALAGLFSALSNLSDLTGPAFAWLALINLTLALFNLLPGFPLDGGRILRAALWRMGGSYRRATRQASRIGQFMAGGFVALALFMLVDGLLFNAVWFGLIAAFLYSAATASFRSAASRSLPLEAPVRRVMRFNVPVIEASTPLAIVAWRYMDQAADQAFPVFEAGRFVGLIAAAQAEQIPRLEWGKTRAGQVMLPASEICVLSPNDALGAALQAMDAAGLEHAPVFEGGRFTGMLNRRDIVYHT
ncbi:MAG: M50 family metallopeptidase [Anaerolineae bacterium]|nr:M50 family metallopeptidase [Anaerolineae bacterium]